MPLPKTKEELLIRLNQAYENLDTEFNFIETNRVRQKEIDGLYSCCDLLTNQIGWANLLLYLEETEQNGMKPQMPAPGFKWNYLGDSAETFYKNEGKKSLSQLRKDFAVKVGMISTWIKSLDEHELFQIQ